MKMLSTRALKHFSAFLQTGRPGLIQRCCMSSSAGKEKGAGKAKQSATPEKTTGSTKESKTPSPPPQAAEVFDNSKYQAGDMYEYNILSFYDMELDMAPSRCTQPSSIKKSS